eukprot:4583672-Karenia_brevis.AAC.1
MKPSVFFIPMKTWPANKHEDSASGQASRIGMKTRHASKYPSSVHANLLYLYWFSLAPAY